MRLLVSLILIFFSLSCIGQKTVQIQGTLRDEDNQVIAFAQILDKTNLRSYISDTSGRFTLKAQINTPFVLEIHFLGFKPTLLKILKNRPGIYAVTIHLQKNIKSLSQLNIKSNNFNNDNFFYLDPEISSVLPNVSGNFETYLKTFPGVSSNNELSSQYSVRGGNYDENLVYINETEVFRPFLIRQGQQEGLSIINPDLVGKIKFSTGGFGAEYGDKMSSVLDITYRKPIITKGSASLSFLGGTFSYESVNNKGNLSFLIGVRERSNQFLLNSLDTHGNYKPLFSDIQSQMDYQINRKTNLTILLYGAFNQYKIIPSNRQTTFGTLALVYNLDVNFLGEEIDRSYLGLASIKLENILSPRTKLKWIASYYSSKESQKKDIQGDYLFSEVEINPGNSGQSSKNPLGIGEYGEVADNKLKFNILSIEHKGRTRLGAHYLNWGLKLSHQNIQMAINQINYLDTLPLNYFNLPNFQAKVIPSDSFNHENELTINRFSLYGQDRLNWGKRIQLEWGIRFTYLDFNRELLTSPRITLNYRPPLDENILIRLSYGWYYQSPVLNEFFNYDGTLSPKRSSQKSIHYILTSDWKFKGLGTELNLTSSLYYKGLKNLIPYQINDVKIDYLGGKTANGYAYGLDFRLSGELVRNLESSLSISLQRTEEKIENYFYPVDSAHLPLQKLAVGYLPRPTDQRFNLTLFFQDKLVGDPSSKVHLSLIYGSNLPIGPPNYEPYRDILRAPAYKRVDIGFSKEFIQGSSHIISGFPFIRSLIVYGEIFNLLNINNTISYFWLTDIAKNQFAVPNYLTGRVLNVRLAAYF